MGSKISDIAKAMKAAEAKTARNAGKLKQEAACMVKHRHCTSVAVMDSLPPTCSELHLHANVNRSSTVDDSGYSHTRWKCMYLLECTDEDTSVMHIVS